MVFSGSYNTALSPPEPQPGQTVFWPAQSSTQPAEAVQCQALQSSFSITASPVERAGFPAQLRPLISTGPTTPEPVRCKLLARSAHCITWLHDHTYESPLDQLCCLLSTHRRCMLGWAEGDNAKSLRFCGKSSEFPHVPPKMDRRHPGGFDQTSCECLQQKCRHW